MSKVRAKNVISRGKQLRHGHVFSPASRAYFAWEAGDLETGQLNQRESGKFFPARVEKLQDAYAPSDVVNFAPPPDGKIASANQGNGEFLDKAGTHWQKHEVRGGEVLDISWNFSAAHTTRRWNYFITKPEWDPQKVLARDQFEPEPFYTVQINLKPYWEHGDAMMPSSPTTHEVPLPLREGYHVLLAVWEVANSGNAFYHILDLDFIADEGGGERPTTPADFTASDVTDKHVALTWSASTGTTPIATYRITRNGVTTIDIDAPLLDWTDNSVAPDTSYTYFISAIDELNNISAPSRAINVLTLGEGGQDGPPTAPKSLHSMKQTANSVSLMWGVSNGPSPVTHYIIFRDGREVSRVSGTQTSYEDAGLTPESEYRYFVAALDQRAQWSVPSNVISVKTEADQGGGEDNPAWKLNTLYQTADLVSHKGSNWRCLQSHTSYTEDWAPGQASSEVLWAAAAKR
ncbi:lytic polysaccharide monooxygenase [Pseudomonas saxonica]|uniref:Chitin-binding protein n=1 Tax=Pseudomonas saxonica TaxID=2600598 RepID=A0A5C5Q1Q5_9PSED|nr:lytic polysaccharide monooxygenase [Pseudomonas saxonica]TWR98212.1 chitin-binding protein [Pseudomonas saxonica]